MRRLRCVLTLVKTSFSPHPDDGGGLIDLVDIVRGFQDRVGSKPGCDLASIVRFLNIKDKSGKEKLQESLNELVDSGKLVCEDGRYFTEKYKFKVFTVSLPEETYVKLKKLSKENKHMPFGFIFHCLIETYGRFPINAKVAPWVR